MPVQEINFITGNRNKVAEVEAILADTVSVKSQSLDLTEIQGSIEDIAVDKCRRAADIVRGKGGKFVLFFFRMWNRELGATGFFTEKTG